MAKIHSFDAFLTDMEKDTIPFEIFGKKYRIPNRMPAAVMLELSRYDAEDTVPTKLLFKAAYMIFGRETIDELAQNPAFSVDTLSAMLGWAFKALNGGAEDDEPVAQTEDDFGVVRGKN